MSIEKEDVEHMLITNSYKTGMNSAYVRQSVKTTFLALKSYIQIHIEVDVEVDAYGLWTLLNLFVPRMSLFSRSIRVEGTRRFAFHI